MHEWLRVCAIALVAISTDRALLWAERRGWVYWRGRNGE